MSFRRPLSIAVLTSSSNMSKIGQKLTSRSVNVWSNPINFCLRHGDKFVRHSLKRVRPSLSVRPSLRLRLSICLCLCLCPVSVTVRLSLSLSLCLCLCLCLSLCLSVSLSLHVSVSLSGISVSLSGLLCLSMSFSISHTLLCVYRPLTNYFCIAIRSCLARPSLITLDSIPVHCPPITRRSSITQTTSDVFELLLSSLTSLHKFRRHN